MRIAIFSDNFYPELSGIADSILTLGKELAARGHEICYFVPRYGKKDYGKVHIESTAELDLGIHIKIVRLPSVHFPTPTTQGRAVIPLGAMSEIRAFNPDVIHTQLFFGAGLDALRAKKKLQKPLVGTNHTAIALYIPPSWPFAKSLSRGMVRYAYWYYAHCDIITAPSEVISRQMQTTGFPKAVRAVSNPIDVSEFHPLQENEREEARKKLGIKGNIIVHAGRLSNERNVGTIVKAFAKLCEQDKDISLAFAGKGAGEEELKELAKRLGVNERVHFMGFLDKKTLNELYNVSRIFVIASTSDTQSMVMMQAMAAGLPTVGVNALALPEYLAHSNGIVVEPEDVDAIADAMDTLLKDGSKCETMGKAARAFVETFSPEHIAKQWEKIYEEAIDSHNRQLTTNH